MELNGKQKSFLRSLAQTMKPVFQVGKDGLNEELLTNIQDYLLKHELIKVSFLPTNPETDDVMKQKLDALGIHLVQEIGHQFVLYKRNPKRKDGIRLPR